MSFGIPVRNGLGIGLRASTTLSTRAGASGPASAISLNFLAGAPLDSRITFTRSSAATVIDSNGLIQTSAINQPRFDYDPTTLALRGLLIEETRTNLLLNSDINGTSLSTQSVTVAAVVHTISFYGTGTIILSGVATATVTGTGVYPNRQTLTFTPTAGVLVCTVTGSVQYAQLEAGAFATSFIPTAATQVTRNVDVAVMTGTNFTSWYNQSEGTFVVTGDTAKPVAVGGTATHNSANDGSNLNSISLVFTSVANGLVRASSVAQTGFAGLAYTANTPIKWGIAYQLNNTALSVAGNAAVVDTSVTIPLALTQMNIGTRNAAADCVNGHIQFINYYNTRLPNATLQALTA